MTPEISSQLNHSINKSIDYFLSLQKSDGHWIFTLEANETIASEYIFLMHYIDELDEDLQNKIVESILSQQKSDGSWSIAYDLPGDISTTIECYFSLKLAGISSSSEQMTNARNFILANGGIKECRIFTRIHLAMFGIIDWYDCPAMPIWFKLFPSYFPINIYEFSSWARATIVPLLIILNEKRTKNLSQGFLNELNFNQDPKDINWSLPFHKEVFSWQNFFLIADKGLKFSDRFGIIPFKKYSIRQCEIWIREHLECVEDIYPLLAYSAIALKLISKNPSEDFHLQKSLFALKTFQIDSLKNDRPHQAIIASENSETIYQQCCVSPVWDTAWMGYTLLEAGVSADHSQLKKSGDWLMNHEINSIYGDWKFKNPEGHPAGWAFEYENDYFPDVDDSMEVMNFLIGLDRSDSKSSIIRATNWLLTMQSNNGGWAAFDKNNTMQLVNLIPFSDHGACLDEPCPDLTGRALEFLASQNYSIHHPKIQRAIRFLESTQHHDGCWEARWAVNYIFGTWCVIEGLIAIGYPKKSPLIQKAIHWIKSVQNSDGGFGESTLSYNNKKYTPLLESVPSQTAWGLMALIAYEDDLDYEINKACQFLIKSQNSDGGWDEKYHTGTGFPEHFYIRYHGYRHYFPLLALSRYKKLINESTKSTPSNRK